MKRLLNTLGTIFICAFALCAQNTHPADSLSAVNRKALEDSVMVGEISRSIVEATLEMDGMDDSEKLFTHWAYAEFMKAASREHLAAFTDDELRDIVRYLQSDAYRFTSSKFFLENFTRNLSKAMMFELGQGNDFSYSLNDGSYATGLAPAFSALSAELMPYVDEKLGNDGEFMTAARRSGAPESQIKSVAAAARRTLGNLYDIYRLTLVDYLSNEKVRYMEDFCQSPLGQKYAEYKADVGNTVEKYSYSGLHEMKDRIMKSDAYELGIGVSDYVSLSRAFPEYFPELYRPYLKLTMKNGTYEGQTRDRVPYGQGMLTDRKGVVYKGAFKNGKRHGLIEVIRPGKQPELQFWIDDKYKKNMPVGQEEDGTVNDVVSYNGKRYGYGGLYDSGNQTSYVGIFVDNQMNGAGQISSRERVAQGSFIDGRLVNGQMRWLNEKWHLNEFQGRMSASVWEGVRRVVHKDGRRQEMFTGIFLKDGLEGRGTKSVAEGKTATEFSGIFAYGKLYGPGVMNHRYTSDNGIVCDEVYTGNFFMDKPHGHGTYAISLTDIPDGSWSIRRLGTSISNISADSTQIIMEGVFDRGTFKDGRITISNGSWYEGTFNSSGLVEGRMLCNYSDGSYYEGECRNGRFHGQGLVRYADGTVYEGQFENGSPVRADAPDDDSALMASLDKAKELRDNGLWNASENERQEKTFRYGESTVGEGKTRLISPCGVKILVRHPDALDVTFKGYFDGDTFLRGKVTMSDGYWMDGEFEDGVLITGKAKTIDKYGTVYEGDIKNGYPHGEGRCTYNDGTWFKGKFANGNRMGGTHYTAEGAVIKVYQ